MAEPRLTHVERLDGREVRAVITFLGERIDRFLPRHPGLRGVAAELGRLVDDLLARGRTASRRRKVLTWVSRVLIVVVLLAALLTIGTALREAVSDDGAEGSLQGLEWLPVIESGINDLVYAGIAIWFLLSLADRVARDDLVRRLHRLRSLAHVIDMHQMGKNPAALLPDIAPAPPEGADVISPRTLSVRDYGVYLDYCSELLSLTAKAAALCAEESTDALVLDTVSEIENLTNGMSRKIWQKISLLSSSTHS